MGKPWENHGKMVIYMENHHAINGKIHYKSQFSIAMLNYQRAKCVADSSTILNVSLFDDCPSILETH
jgi:hypothetical protein